MTIAITTPALLFPAISLLLLAYTSRFLATGQLIRGLSANARTGEVPKASKQIKNLKKRVELIKIMQILGVLSLFLCTLSMFLLFIKWDFLGNTIFGISLLFMCASLITALVEITISTNAINIELQGIKKNVKEHTIKNKQEDKSQEAEPNIDEIILDKQETL